MNVYVQSTGDWLLDGALLGKGYSGFGPYKNEPAAQVLKGLGPIPQGVWRIAGVLDQTKDHGPFVLVLDPNENTDTFGREGFLVHGDSLTHAGCASHGCVIMDKAVRHAIWESGDRELLVVAKPSQFTGERSDGLGPDDITPVDRPVAKPEGEKP